MIGNEGKRMNATVAESPVREKVMGYTFDAHRLVHLGREHGAAGRVLQRLYSGVLRGTACGDIHAGAATGMGISLSYGTVHPRPSAWEPLSWFRHLKVR